LYIASILVFVFLSVGVFVLLAAIRNFVATTFEFRPIPDSRLGLRPIGLRLRKQPAWGNALWFVANAGMFAVAVGGLVYVNTSALALLRR
jgi:hypothetical protein